MKISGLGKHMLSAGLTPSEVAVRLQTYGKNMIEVELKPIIYLLFREVISPFYMFEVFS